MPVAAKSGPDVDLPQIVFWALMLLLVLEYLGLSAQFPILRTTRFTTLLAYGLLGVSIMAGGLGRAFASRQGKLLLFLLLLAASSVFYAVVKSYVPVNVRAQGDYLGLFVVVAAVVDRRTRVTRLALVGTLIIAGLVLRNLDILTSGVRVGAFRAAPFMGDGNDFAWGIITLTPLPLFLLLGKHGLLTRLIGLSGLCTAIFAVMGTQSRGATLAMATAGLFYVLVLSKRRLMAAVTIAMVAVAVVSFSTENYLDRLTDTDIESDTSAQGRLRAWRAGFQMALDYPLGVGVGSFNSAYGRYYMPEDDGSYGSLRWISAHSIYFKVLGESGFIGLALLLGVIAANFFDNRRCHKYARANPDRVAIEDRWPALLNFGLIGYAVAGAFLGGSSYPHLYLLSGLALGCRGMTVDYVSESPAVQAAEPVRPRAVPARIPAHRPRPGTLTPVARRHVRT